MLMYAYLYITSQKDNSNGKVEDKPLSESPPWREKPEQNHQTQHHILRQIHAI